MAAVETFSAFGLKLTVIHRSLVATAILFASVGLASCADGSQGAQPITRAVHLGPDNRTLSVRAVIGGCQTATLLSNERSAVIRLTLQIPTRKPESGEACSANVELRLVSTTLKAALNGRRIVDGITGNQLTVSTAKP